MTDIISSPKANLVLDATKIDLFQLCEARFDFRVNQNKVLPLVQKSRSLDLGSLAHEGLEVYFNMLKEGKHYNDRMQAAVLKIHEKAANPDNSNLEAEEVGPLAKAVEESCDYWRAEDETLSVLAVESPFDYILYEDDYVRIIISGKIDLLVDVPQIGQNSGYKNLPFDHKTFSRSFPVMRLSNQFINYANVCGSNFLIVNKIGLQKTLKPNEKYLRVPLSYDPDIIQQWKDNVITMVLKNYLTCVSENKWSMNFTSCFKFNRLCEYYDICDSSGEDAKKWKLESNYVEGRAWDKYGKIKEE